jgi:hypothetical protein
VHLCVVCNPPFPFCIYYIGRLAAQRLNIARAAGVAQITFTNEVNDEIVPKLILGFSYMETGYQ